MRRTSHLLFGGRQPGLHGGQLLLEAIQLHAGLFSLRCCVLRRHGGAHQRHDTKVASRFPMQACWSRGRNERGSVLTCEHPS